MCWFDVGDVDVVVEDVGDVDVVVEDVGDVNVVVEDVGDVDVVVEDVGDVNVCIAIGVENVFVNINVVVGFNVFAVLIVVVCLVKQ